MSTPSKRLQAVTFDVGGTLIRPWPSVGHVYAEAARRHGFSDVSPAVLSDRFLEAWRAMPGFDYTRGGWKKLVDETFRGVIESPVSAAFFDDLYETFARPDAWNVYDDVFVTLDQLASRGLRLAVISNWDDRLPGLLKAMGLHGRFEVFSISCEIGFAKPSPHIFHDAAEKLRIAPSSILHVGDSDEMDYKGAMQAGFNARLLRRNRTPEVAHSVATLSELIALAAGD